MTSRLFTRANKICVIFKGMEEDGKGRTTEAKPHSGNTQSRDRTRWADSVNKDKKRGRDKRGKAMLKEYMLRDD